MKLTSPLVLSMRDLVKAAAVCGFIAAAACAQAAPVTYTFQTSGPLNSINTALLAQLDGATGISGQFTYDAAVPLTAMSRELGYTDDMSVYIGTPQTGFALSGFSGKLGGLALSFSDLQGVVSVGKDVSWDPTDPLDFVELAADPSADSMTGVAPAAMTRHLNGFTLPGYALHNVRIIWTSVQAGGHFLDDQAMPSTPPSFQGIIGLDFVALDETQGLPYYYNNTVYIDGLTVQAVSVPEISTGAMLLAGLAAMAATAVMRRTQG